MAGTPSRAHWRAAAFALLLLAAGTTALPAGRGADGNCSGAVPEAVGRLRANDPADLPAELAWKPDPHGCATATVVERSDAGGPFRVVAQLPGDARGWADASAKPCTAATYRVHQVNGAGAGAPAAVDGTRGTGSVPDAPTALVQYPYPYPFLVLLQWQPPAASADCPVRAYSVTREQAGTVTALGQTYGPLQRYWYDWTFAPCAQATYRVTALNVVGASEPAALTLTTPVRGPAAPQGLAATDPSPGTVRLSWSAPASNGCPLDGYTVWRDGKAVATLPASVASWEDLGVLPCQKASYAVSGFNAQQGVQASVAHVHQPLGATAPCPATFARPI